MNDAVTVAIIAVGGTLGAGLLTFCGTLIAQYFSRLAEQGRQVHEREIKRMELAHSTQEKRREERVEAYNTFYSKAQLLVLQLSMLEGADGKVGTAFDTPADFAEKLAQDTVQQMQDLYTAYADLELIAPISVTSAASATGSALRTIFENTYSGNSTDEGWDQVYEGMDNFRGATADDLNDLDTVLLSRTP